MKWRVRAKSGTSFEREIRSKREITLSQETVSVAYPLHLCGM